MRSSKPQPVPGLDAVKAIASQLIVLHHLALYGPMSDVAWKLAPDLLAWFSNHARLAVQLFIVVAGFLTAHTLAPNGRLQSPAPHALLARRYLRLILPFIAALLLTIAASWWARGQLDHDLVPEAPGVGQFIAHVFLLQDVLKLKSLSAGAWYMAIDLQLFALFLGMMWLGSRFERWTKTAASIGPWFVLALGLSGLFYFNLDASWDHWGVYFFGAYALGASARWAMNSIAALDRFCLLLSLVAMALLFDYRSRVLLASLIALGLLISLRRPQLLAWLERPSIQYLGKISYSIFLIHFAVLLIVNPVFISLFPTSPLMNAIGMLVAWAGSVAAGAAFYRWIEVPALAWSRRVAPRPAALRPYQTI
jgi:peptidoglycan/LPS O-acetylase OafA/YrhL